MNESHKKCVSEVVIQVLKATGNTSLHYHDSGLFALVAKKMNKPGLADDYYFDLRRALIRNCGRLRKTKSKVNGRAVANYHLPPEDMPLKPAAPIVVPFSCRIKDETTGLVHIMMPPSMISHALCQKVKARADIAATNEVITCKDCKIIAEYAARFTGTHPNANEESHAREEASQV